VARGFGDLEAVVMDRLWDRDGATTVREIFEDMLREREIAYTTVMSTMDNLTTRAGCRGNATVRHICTGRP
jgi:predicted transcriptional regulator